MLRAAVTAHAWRTPLGGDIDTAMRRLYAGERAARPDAERSSYACKLFAPISDEPRPSRHQRFLSRLGLLALEVGREAAAGVACENLGIFTAVSGLQAQWCELLPALSEIDSGWHAFRRVHPFWLLKYLSNNVHALLSEDLAARGEGACFGGATAAVQALRAASAALAEGAIDAALVVAYDSLLEPERLIDAAARGVCSVTESFVPPYHPNAAGSVPGEAAVAVVLKRPAPALPTVSAHGGCDGAFELPDVALLESLLRGIPGPVIVDGSGRASLPFDRAERALVTRLWGDDAWLTASAAAMGDTGAAQPLVQLVVACEMLRRGVAVPVAGSRNSGNSRASPIRARTAVGVTVGAPGLAGVVCVTPPTLDA